MEDPFQNFEIDEAEERPQRHFVAHSYTPRDLSLGWFMDYSVEEMLAMHPKTGAGHVLSMAEYCYLKRRFQDAFDLCSKLLSQPSVCDLAAELRTRCFLKLSHADSSLNPEMLKGAGEDVCAKVKLLVRADKFEEAIQSLVCRNPSKDYYLIIYLSNCFFERCKTFSGKRQLALERACCLLLSQALAVYDRAIAGYRLKESAELFQLHNDSEIRPARARVADLSLKALDVSDDDMREELQLSIDSIQKLTAF
ncbi:MAG: hypothetical protein SGCHY_000144 [Lobulomycetales sp.]